MQPIIIAGVIIFIIIIIIVIYLVNQTSYKTYSVQDFVQFTGPDTDLPDQPITGTLEQCQTACTDAGNCIGFSREKNILDSLESACYLKSSFPNKTMNNNMWHTYSNIE
jgi:hypothetical protein